MNVTAADWGVLLLIVLALFVLGLVLATRRSHAVGFREAAGWSVFFVTMAAGPRGPRRPGEAGVRGQFFAGYIVAASLCLGAAFIALGAALLELLWSGTGQACRRTGRSG